MCPETKGLSTEVPPFSSLSKPRNSDKESAVLDGLKTRMLVMLVLCTGPFREKAKPGGWEIMSWGFKIPMFKIPIKSKYLGDHVVGVDNQEYFKHLGDHVVGVAHVR